MFDSAPILPHPRPLLQSPAFFRALTAAGQTPCRLSDGTILMTRRLPGGLRLSHVHRAELDPARLPGLVAEAGLRRRPMLLQPDRPCPGLKRIGALPLRRGAQALELPLDGDLEAGLAPIWRHRLGHAATQGLSVTQTNLPMDPGHWIFGALPPGRRSRMPVSVLTLAYAAANPGDAKLFTAHVGQTRIAAILLLLHGEGATWHMARTTPHGHARAAHYLLLWQAIRWLADHGYARLDLGLMGGPAPESDAFRLGTGALTRQLGETWAWWPPMARIRLPWRARHRAGQPSTGPATPAR